MVSNFFYLIVMIGVCATPALASVSAPELDSSTLTGLAAAVTGCIAAFRMHQAKRK
jgi:hypothetical protein